MARPKSSPAPEDRDRPRDRPERGAEGDQRGRVVEQALALEDGDDPARHADAPRDGGGRDGVRRRDDGAERDRGGEGQPGQQEDGDAGHGERGDEDEPDGEQRDLPPVAPDVDEGRPDRGGVEQRRQDAREDDLGREGVLGDPGDERRDDAHRGEHERRGEAEAGADAGRR